MKLSKIRTVTVNKKTGEGYVVFTTGEGDPPETPLDHVGLSNGKLTTRARRMQRYMLDTTNWKSTQTESEDFGPNTWLIIRDHIIDNDIPHIVFGVGDDLVETISINVLPAWYENRDHWTLQKIRDAKRNK